MPGIIVLNLADATPVILGMKFLEMTAVRAAPDNDAVLNQSRIRRDGPRFGANQPKPDDARRIANTTFHSFLGIPRPGFWVRKA